MQRRFKHCIWRYQSRMSTTTKASRKSTYGYIRKYPYDTTMEYIITMLKVSDSSNSATGECCLLRRRLFPSSRNPRICAARVADKSWDVNHWARFRGYSTEVRKPDMV